MIVSAALLTDLKRELRNLEGDLRDRAEDQSTDWGTRLREEHRRAQARERTGLAWIEWRDGEVSQAAVAWIVATVFIRFAEDNDLLIGASQNGRPVSLPWIAAPGDGLERAVENETTFYAAGPTRTTRDWLQDAFGTLVELPAGRPLVDPGHSPVWHAPISATASDALLTFFRRTTPDGALVHDFSDPDLDTRFLGDLYQDLSDYAKKTYALLQTPVFVEEFILDQTLAPAIAEFGLTGLKVIDPACGSGHFLLGAFERLTAKWAETAPGVERGERVQRALDSIHGVDLNPFAIAIARFRLTVAALKAAGLKSFVGAPAFKYHLAIGDSLLGAVDYQTTLDLGDEQGFEYNSEDLQEHRDILKPGQYHVVVANPPYITVKDKVLNQRYRSLYRSCAGKYALTVPFAELLFGLARPGANGSPAGYVGQITANSFMKREFGKKLIEQFLSGADTHTRVDLTHIVDTSVATIPGHGTPTVILVGRRRRPLDDGIRAVLGIRGEPSPPAEPSEGLVWREIVSHIDDYGFEGTYVTVATRPRSEFSNYPWSLSGGGAGDLKELLDGERPVLASLAESLGIASFTLADDVFVRSEADWRRAGVSEIRPMIVGDAARDWRVLSMASAFFPYDSSFEPLGETISEPAMRALWPYRALLESGILFGGVTKKEAGIHWTEFGRLTASKLKTPLTIVVAFVGTHNQFLLDRGGNVFKETARIIKFGPEFSEDEHLGILGLLNSSVGCFWLKEVCHNKGGPGGGSSKDEKWRDFYEFAPTKLEQFPLPLEFPVSLARQLDETAKLLNDFSPRRIAKQGRIALENARERWEELRREMVALQEELDWQVYTAFGLVGRELAPANPEIVPMNPGERPFEVRLARAAAGGEIQTRWFELNEHVATVLAPKLGSAAWQELWQARYDAADSGALRLVENLETKRPWVALAWNSLQAEAVREAVLDRLESPELWYDLSKRPLVRSVAQLADELRHDSQLRDLLSIHTGSEDYDLGTEIGRLLDFSAVPALANLRYKSSGLEKFRAWERAWELQRAVDRGETVVVPVPAKYVQGDFLKTTYWSARGKLDVPKERFIAFPGSRYKEDATYTYGWAGWDHGERGQAIARFANDIARAGVPDDQVIPLVAALIEQEPWLKQWHDEIGAAGVSPATAVAGIITALLGRLGLGRDTVVDWPPTTPRAGRRNA